MIRDPSADEILATVKQWLEQHAKSPSSRDKYFARVAENAVGIVRREVALGAVMEAEEAARLRKIWNRDGSRDELNAALCKALREGGLDEHTPGVLAHLKQTISRQIEIDQPNYRSLPPNSPSPPG